MLSHTSSSSFPLHLLAACWGGDSQDGWRFVNTSPVPWTCCITPVPSSILTKPSHLPNIIFSLSLWPQAAKEDKVKEVKEYVDHQPGTLCFRDVCELMLIADGSFPTVPLDLSHDSDQMKVAPKMFA